MSDEVSTTEDEWEDWTIDEIVEEYNDSLAKILEHVGYNPQQSWKVFPLEDSRDRYWIINEDTGRDVMNSPKREALVYWHEHQDGDDEFGPYADCIYGDTFYYHSGRDNVYRGKELTLIVVDTHCDGNLFLKLFRNDREIKP